MSRSIMDTLQSYHSDSWGWALACCDWEHSLAEDTLQEAYLRVLDGRARFRGEASEKTWFFGIIRRVSLEQRRSRSRVVQLATRLFAEKEEPEVQSLLHDLHQDESREQFVQALQLLSERQREVLHLVFYANLTLEEAAATLDLSLGSVRTHYHRGKAQLAQQLEIEND